MKKWSKKFINKRPSDIVCSYSNNAKKAKREVLIPPKLWIEISKAIEQCPLTKSLEEHKATSLTKSIIELKLETAVMAGFAIGWAEKSRNIK